MIIEMDLHAIELVNFLDLYSLFFINRIVVNVVMDIKSTIHNNKM